ncbi:MAG: exo-alpha-sialidase [bacterium]|nr:exo-alpha-sialidase [bacterium]
MSSGIYLGSPTLLRLPDGALLAGMDMFGSNAPKPAVSLIFRSEDNGDTWRCISEIRGSFWANLFLHRDRLYFLGTSNPNGSIVIRRSDDGGYTWTEPADENSGLLFPEGDMKHYHCAPMPVVEHKGRLYRAFENNATEQWPAGFRSLVLSVDVDADLLKASSWRKSNELIYDPDADPAEFGTAPEIPGGKAAGWLEGNVVEAPDGEMVNILRVNSAPVVNRAAIVHIHDEGRRVTFDPKTGFIEFPGGMTKFAIRRDPESGRYWTLANGNTNPKNPTQRNSLSLYSSSDLIHWKQHAVLLEDLDDYENIGNESKVGFQYVDFQFDGDDIIFLSRTAYNGAHSYHDANYMTFHRIENFRDRFKD